MMKRGVSLIVMALIAFTLFSCAGAGHNQNRGTAVGTGVGAGVGAILGQVIGGDTESTLIGAGIGAALGGLAGNQIGAYMDRQEQELRAIAAASEAASVRRNQDVLTATFKSDMFFDYDSAVLKSGAYSEIGRVADMLNRFPQTRIRVEGHTDTTGSEEYNMRLSQRRADAVKTALTGRGVDPVRIDTVGYGESMPVSSSHAANRRVNVVITPIVAS